jgi:dTDP-4-dehydrorhamnose reductase
MATDNVLSITAADETADAIVKLTGNTNHSIYHLVASPSILRSDIADTIINSSRFGKIMSYQPISFSDLDYLEGRPLFGSLNGERFCAEFSFQFSSPKKIIKQKVQLLDMCLKSENIK